MKLVHILAPVGFGGGEKILLELIEEFNKENCFSSFLLLNESKKFSRELDVRGVNHESLTKLSLGDSPRKGQYVLVALLALMGFFYNFKKVRDLLKNSCIVAHGFPSNIVAVIAARIFKIKKVVYVNHSKKGAMSLFSRKMYLLFLSQFNKIISVGPKAEESFNKIFPELEKINLRINNGIDLEKFNKKRSCIKQNATAIYVARFSPTKNHKFLIDVMVQVKGFELLLIGEGGELERVKEYAAVCGVAERIQFLGSLSYDAVCEYYSESGFCLFPSLYEGFGLTIVEALANSLPVVMFRETYDPIFGEACLVSRNEEEFISNLRCLLNDTEEYERKAGIALETSQAFSIKACAKNYLKVINGI